MKTGTFKWVRVPVLIPVVLMFCCGLTVHAQEASPVKPIKYRSLFDQDLLQRGLVDMELVNDRSLKNRTSFLVQGICRGTKPLKSAEVDNTKTFDNFFRRYYFPMMTHPNELGNIAQMRQELMKKYFGGIKNDAAAQEVRDRLNDLTLSYMWGLCGTKLGTFHPAVRYNAMLIIGDLNSRGAESIGNPRPDEPLLKALEVMRAELISKDQIDAVRVAALIGITRHADLDRHRPEGRRIPDVALRNLIGDLLRLAAEKDAPAGRTAQGHTWMRRQAVEALALLATTRPIGPVAELMDKIISDPDEPLSLRCTVAEAQGKMRSPLAEGVTAEQAAMKLVRLADEILGTELDQLDPYLTELEAAEDANTGSGSGINGGSRFSEGGGIDLFSASSSPTDDDDTTALEPERAPKVVATQRRGKARLNCVYNGLFGNEGGPGLAAGIKDASAKANVGSVEKLISDTEDILVDQAPLGEKPLFAEVKTYFDLINVQREAFGAIAPPAREAAPVELGPGGLDAGPGGETDSGPAETLPPELGSLP